ncbi:CaiB/BaiF CoA transferase family protein [Streptomyces sp. NPDC051217]|uniref:CaiB/BaiF CoA transferase family protein n=1 Tax=Streptomyces sp. NPDC051217 TaxID=3365644 RepID=UPI00379D8F31
MGIDERLPLTGIRVADFSWVGAGPFMTKPLADHGAEVIKVESRTRTDVIRSMHPFRDGKPGVDRSGYFANRNTSKRSICLDLRTGRGRALALDLIARSDVVVNNFTPGTMARLGLGYEHAREVRPDVIYLDMPMQGNVGPHHRHRGYGLSIGALSGLYELCGYSDRPPVGTGTNYPDHVPNPLHGTIAVLSALRRRSRTGEGCRIELAQIESTINVIGPAIVAAAAGQPVTRNGNRDDFYAPNGVYPCRGTDEWCAISIASDEQWQVLVECVDQDGALRQEDFSTAQGRRNHADRLDPLIAAATRGFGAHELTALLVVRDIAAARVASAHDVLHDDPQLRARHHWVVLDHPEMGPSVYDNLPYTLSGTPGHLRSPAPLLGADTHDVCTQLLGMDEDDYDKALKEGAVG